MASCPKPVVRAQTAPHPKVPTSTRRPHWVVLGFEKDLRKAPLSVQKHAIHDKDFVVFTNKDSEVYIADDVCPHRGASLSAGRVSGPDCIRCAYHGMAIGVENCPKQFYEYANLQGIVWMDYASKVVTQHFAPPTAAEFSDDDFHTFEYTKTLHVNPVLMTENTLDWQHLEHIHRFSFVKGVPPAIAVQATGSHGKASYTYALEDTILPFSELCVENEYWIPFTTSLRFRLKDRVTGGVSTAFYLWFSLTPTKNGDVKLHARVSRTVCKQLPFITDAIFKLIDEIPLLEDASIVSMVSPASWSANLLTPADAFIKAYRDAMTRNYPDLLSWYVQ
jgi:nitrite reductase/ring-hydroxylating ferredoxin subunit